MMDENINDTALNEDIVDTQDKELNTSHFMSFVKRNSNYLKPLLFASIIKFGVIVLFINGNINRFFRDPFFINLFLSSLTFLILSIVVLFLKDKILNLIFKNILKCTYFILVGLLLIYWGGTSL
jgi:hypothetical protein